MPYTILEWFILFIPPIKIHKHMVTYGPYGVLGDGYTVWLKTHETGPVSKTGHLAKTFGRRRPDAPPTAQPRLLNHSPDSGWGGDRTCYAGGPLYRSGTRPIGGNRLRSRKSPQDSGDLVLRSPKVNRVWSTFGVDQFTLFIPFHKDMYKFYMSCHF